jgi:AcrR family transcriptional regulator
MATAQRLFYRNGYRAVGIDRLLAEAGVAKMTLYHHFPSKDDLIVAVVESQDATVRAGLEGAIAAAGSAPTLRLLAVFDWLDAWFKTDDFRGCGFIRAMSEFPNPDHPVHRAAWRHKETVNARLRELATEADVRHPAELANALSLLIDGAILAAHATGSATSAATAKATAASLLKQATE